MSNIPSSWKDMVINHAEINDDFSDFQVVKQSKTKNQKKNSKDILEISTLQEFLYMVKSKKQMYVDFVINDDAHCPHSYEGTLCKNVRQCGQIHIQRCIYNTNCTKKNCFYLHSNDMPTKEAKDNFMKTMDKYNQIKNKKRVDY